MTDPDQPPSDPALGDRVRQGNRMLLARLVIGLGLGFAGLLVHAHLIGPHGYGIYASAAALVLTTQSIASWGIPIWLLRQVRTVDGRTLSAAVTVLLLAGVAAAAVAAAGAAAVLSGSLAEAREVAWFMLAILALTLPAQVGQASLERAQRYRLIGVVELSASTLFVLLGAGLAWWFPSPWALAIAWGGQEILLAVAWRAGSGVPIAIGGGRSAIRDAFLSGSRNAAVATAWQARALITPLVVGHLCDAAAVGVTQLASRLVAAASTLRNVVWRTSGPALAAIRDDTAAMLRFERSASLGLSLGVGLPLVVLAVAAATMLPTLLGTRWQDLGSAVPFYAAASLASCLSTLPTAALVARERSMDVAAFSLVSTMVLLIATVALVPWFGWLGAAVAELAAVPVLVLLLRSHRRWIGDLDLRPAVLGAAAMAVGAAMPLLGWLALAAPVLWLLMSAEHRDLRPLLGTRRA